MNNLKTQGLVLIDVDVAALNNAGKSTTSNFDNAVATKTIRKNGMKYTYVSGQAWRFWWRDTLQKQIGWELSPIVRESKVAFTEANPIKYADDDIFGYMRAAKAEITDENGEVIKDSKGKAKTENVTVTRVSPLKNSAIVSVSAVSTEENWSSMARQDGDSVPYSKEEYSAIMKGMFALDLAHAGTFSNYNKTGFKNLTDLLKAEALSSGAHEIPDPFVKDSKGEAHKLIRLSKEIRTKRITETIKALKFISGGAMQTSNMADVTPKFIILSTMTVGNHPFTHIFTSGVNKTTVKFNADGLEEVLNDYDAQFKGGIYIGVRSGFLDREDMNALTAIAQKFEHIHVKSVNEAIDEYCAEIEKYIE
ncbi:MAG: type I-B CRISPR-associated protein Cas7/Cst2/DevR [Saprospiraceae bacterium]|nr:type I-B CRISPR-associated protein Cas7/Cst2/DevR [Saprospiraceae bacterium]